MLPWPWPFRLSVWLSEWFSVCQRFGSGLKIRRIAKKISPGNPSSSPSSSCCWSPFWCHLLANIPGVHTQFLSSPTQHQRPHSPLCSLSVRAEVQTEAGRRIEILAVSTGTTLGVDTLWTHARPLSPSGRSHSTRGSGSTRANERLVPVHRSSDCSCTRVVDDFGRSHFPTDAATDPICETAD